MADAAATEREDTVRSRDIIDRASWILVPMLLASGLSDRALGATIGYWRFDDPGATNGGVIGTTVSEVNSSALDATGQSGAQYTDSVPGALIRDPVSGVTYANQFSLNGPGNVEYVTVPNSTLLNTTDFTVELFLRIIGQPNSYDSFVRRAQGSDPRWQIDFSHGDTADSFGKIRARFDNAGQTNVVPTGDYVFVDTDTGSGDPADYTEATDDVADEGDGINDDLSWHHIALTYDASERRTTIFTDYEQGSSRTLNEAFTQPDAILQIGNFYTGYGLMIDEFRYSDSVLSTSQFLRVVPEPSALVLLALGALAILGFGRRRGSVARR